MPMLEVLFGDSKRVYKKPDFDNLSNFGNNLEEWINYHVNNFSGNDPEKALIVVITIIIILFFFKNLFNYIAMFFITFLRNGLLKDLRNKIENTNPSSVLDGNIDQFIEEGIKNKK